MKLYATTTSERGKSVGKGGNEWLQINIFDEARICHGTIEILPNLNMFIKYRGKKIEIKGKQKSSIPARLEYLRQELRAERISYAELAELQTLAPHIAADDVELLEAAGVSEQKKKSEKSARQMMEQAAIDLKII